MNLDDFFRGFEESEKTFDALRELIEPLDPVEMSVTKSQISFRRRSPFAWAWVPARYLGGNPAPLVLSLVFRRRDPSPRWKEVVEPSPGRFMHHIELRSTEELDGEVRRWIEQAWAEAA
jgi:hypothetical protein